MGAKVVEVNNADGPGISYFDLSRFDAKDGIAGPRSPAEFDALEVLKAASGSSTRISRA
jgi:hypothetical protein